MTTPAQFTVAPLGKGSLVFLLALVVVLPFIISVWAIAQVPLAERATPAAASMLALGPIVAVLLLSLRRRGITIDGSTLVVRATFYTARSGAAEFLLDQASIVDLRERTALKPGIKTNGYALPGFWAGHFRLRDRRKAFCLVTDQGKVLVLPRADGSVWLLSPERPQPLLDALRRSRG